MSNSSQKLKTSVFSLTVNINSFKSYVKQSDKIIMLIRLSRLTILELSFDKSDKYFRFLLLNLGFKINKK